jgi:hypothetical protein
LDRRLHLECSPKPLRRKSPTIIAVDAAHPGAAILPTMFGIFFEEINFAADGGLYPERIKNRSFEFDQPLTGSAPTSTSLPRPNLTGRKANSTSVLGHGLPRVGSIEIHSKYPAGFRGFL